MAAKTRETQIQVKVNQQEKQLYARAAQTYNLTLSAYARMAMEYVARNKPSLAVEPFLDDPMPRSMMSERANHQ